MKCVNCKNLGKLKDEDGVPYDWCEKVCDNPDIHAERKCKHYLVASHADKIRAMSDEELAEWLGALTKFCGNDYCGKRCPLVSLCFSRGTALDWLQKEAEEGET